MSNLDHIAKQTALEALAKGKNIYIYILQKMKCKGRHAVTKLVGALCYKPEGNGFESR
jgi:hypothetical protein